MPVLEFQRIHSIPVYTFVYTLHARIHERYTYRCIHNICVCTHMYIEREVYLFVCLFIYRFMHISDMSLAAAEQPRAQKQLLSKASWRSTWTRSVIWAAPRRHLLLSPRPRKVLKTERYRDYFVGSLYYEVSLYII